MPLPHEIKMSQLGSTTIERIIVDAIYDHALGNPEALAIRVIGALAQVGCRILSRSNIVAMLEDSAQLSAVRRADARKAPAGHLW
jgi:hypothetical protein